jgi:hypothetical protein
VKIRGGRGTAGAVFRGSVGLGVLLCWVTTLLAVILYIALLSWKWQLLVVLFHLP